MAKKKGAQQNNAPENPVASSGVPDCSPENISQYVLQAGGEKHRVHDVHYAANSFNPHPTSNARFSTLHDAEGRVIPTLYLAETFDVSVMETVFHDVPYASGFKSIAKSKLINLVHSRVTINVDLNLVDLTAKPLRKLGIKPEQIVTSEKIDYPFSRAVAKEIYIKNPEVQGIRWMSRQDNTHSAYVLFEDRVPEMAIEIVGNSRKLIDEAFDDVIEVAEKIGVHIVPDK